MIYKMNKLDTYRNQIDKIDAEIIWLLKIRFDIVKNKILPYKKNSTSNPINHKDIVKLLKIFAKSLIPWSQKDL